MIKKRFIATLLVAVLTVGMSFNAVAAPVSRQSGKATITDGEIKGEALATYAEEFGFDMNTDDGYTLQKIVVTAKATPNYANTTNPTPKAWGDYVADVELDNSDVYFPNNPIASNWFEGPLSQLVLTYTRNVKATSSSTVTISADIIEAGVGFSVEGSIEQSVQATRPAITASQKINIKEFGLYDAYRFNIYSSSGNLKGNGLAYQPMGLYVAQAVYAK